MPKVQVSMESEGQESERMPKMQKTPRLITISEERLDLIIAKLKRIEDRLREVAEK